MKRLLFKTILKGYAGITIYPFIFLKYNENEDSNYAIKVNHERIHLKQQLETLIVIFYLIYIINYLFNLLIYKGDAKKAYRNITFEKEAYKNEKDFNYLKNRHLFGWLIN